MSLRCPPIKFGSIGPTVWEEMSFEEFKDGRQDGRHGGHLGYRNETILAILNLYNAPIPPIKFRLNLTVWEEMLFEEFQDGPLGTERF